MIIDSNNVTLFKGLRFLYHSTVGCYSPSHCVFHSSASPVSSNASVRVCGVGVASFLVPHSVLAATSLPGIRMTKYLLPCHASSSEDEVFYPVSNTCFCSLYHLVKPANLISSIVNSAKPTPGPLPPLLHPKLQLATVSSFMDPKQHFTALCTAKLHWETITHLTHLWTWYVTP